MGLDMYAYRAPAAMVGDAQIDLNDLLFKDGNAPLWANSVGNTLQARNIKKVQV